MWQYNQREKHIARMRRRYILFRSIRAVNSSEMIVAGGPCKFAAMNAERRLAAGASFRLRIVFVDSAKYVFLPSGRLGTPCVMLRSAVNYEDNFESCVCVLHITSFRLREFLPCKPICLKPTTRPPHPPVRRRHRSLPPFASRARTIAAPPVGRGAIVIKQTDLSGNLRSRDPRNTFRRRRIGSDPRAEIQRERSGAIPREIPRELRHVEFILLRINVCLRK